MHTLYLDPEKWDLTLDNGGNIAYAADPYSKAQDAASAIRLFYGELYYDVGKGIPYFDEILGKPHSYALYKYRMEQAVLSVPGIRKVEVKIETENNRAVSGAVVFWDEQNNSYTVGL